MRQLLWDGRKIVLTDKGGKRYVYYTMSETYGRV